MDRKSYTFFVFFFFYSEESSSEKEAIYLKRLLVKLNARSDVPVILNINNQGAQKLAENPVFHKRSKHIDIKFHHIRELVRSGQMELVYCQTADKFDMI